MPRPPTSGAHARGRGPPSAPTLRTGHRAQLGRRPQASSAERMFCAAAHRSRSGTVPRASPYSAIGHADRPRPDQRRRRRHRRQRGARSASGSPRRARPGAQLVALPRAGDHRLPARGPAAQGALPGRRARGASTGSPPTRTGIVALVGFPERADDVYNAAAVLRRRRGRRRSTARCSLPNYGVFDEVPLLPDAARAAALIEVDGVSVGLTICEDIWVPGPPLTDEALAGATADRQHLRLALPRRQGRSSASR